MKRLFIILALSILLSGLAYAEGVIIELKGSYFAPSEKNFMDIYGAGLMYGGEATFRIWRNIEIWAEVNYFRKEGELTLTKDKTKLEILPIGGGLKYRLYFGRLSFYGGLGLGYFISEESNVIGDVTKNGLGYIGKIGSYIKIINGLLIDLNINYSYCKIKPPDFGVNIGGLTAGIGIGYEF